MPPWSERSTALRLFVRRSEVSGNGALNRESAGECRTVMTGFERHGPFRPECCGRRIHAGGPAGSDEVTHHVGRAGLAADRQSITRASSPTRSGLSEGPASVARYQPG